MNLSQLRFAAATAEELSFSRAAERCHVTQPALSNGLALLEAELGGPLFLRTTRKVELSPFGAHVMPLVEAVLRAQAELEAGVRAFHEPAEPIVRIGLSPLVDVRLVSRVLEPWEAEHPGARLFFKECFLDDLDARLRAAQIDVAIRPRLAVRRPGGAVVQRTLYEEDLFYLPRQVSGAYPEAAGSVALADVGAETFVLGADGCGLAATTRALFREAGRELREYTGQALSFQVMQEWADLGIGATILPESKVAPQFRSRARRLMRKAGEPARVTFEAAWARGARPRHLADLKRHFEERVPKLVAGAAPAPLGAAAPRRTGRLVASARRSA